jgi:FKBP-type peptidyl-prolyl cis-trans isomerase FkpA
MSRVAFIWRSIIRAGCLLAIALSAASCGGGSDMAPSATPMPSAPFTKTDLREGTGATATLGRTVMVSYTGWLYDPTRAESKGTQFDTSTNFSFQLGAGRVIQGWDQGVVDMKVGGQRRLVIPPNLAYGSQGAGGVIPPNATLVFDITLLNVS